MVRTSGSGRRWRSTALSTAVREHRAHAQQRVVRLLAGSESSMWVQVSCCVASGLTSAFLPGLKVRRTSQQYAILERGGGVGECDQRGQRRRDRCGWVRYRQSPVLVRHTGPSDRGRSGTVQMSVSPCHRCIRRCPAALLPRASLAASSTQASAPRHFSQHGRH